MAIVSATWVRWGLGGLFLVMTPLVIGGQVAPTRGGDPAEDVEPAVEEKLGEKLIRRTVQGTEDDVMTRISVLMDTAAKRIDVDLDASAETQAIQREALDQLDRAIKQAAKNRKPRLTPKPSSDKRESANPAKSKGQPKGKPEAAPGDDATAKAGQVGNAAANDAKSKAGGELKESRRPWGNLPERDREEVIQGINEASVQRYRAWIEQYYRALQEVE